MSGLWLGYHCVVLAVCLGSLSCWKVNLHPSLRSWVLWSRFSSRISLYFSLLIFPLILTSLPVHIAEKHPHTVDAASTMLHHRDGAKFPPDVTLGIKSSILVSSDQRILYLMVWESFDKRLKCL
jgi:hypothetical protein